MTSTRQTSISATVATFARRLKRSNPAATPAKPAHNMTRRRLTMRISGTMDAAAHNASAVERRQAPRKGHEHDANHKEHRAGNGDRPEFSDAVLQRGDDAPMAENELGSCDRGDPEQVGRMGQPKDCAAADHEQAQRHDNRNRGGSQAHQQRAGVELRGAPPGLCFRLS